MVSENQRVVLITGASSGIGKACASHLAAQGFRVYATSRRPSSITAPNLTMLAADVNHDDSVEQTVAAIIEREGRIDVVINNAGMGIAGPLENTTTEHAKAQFEVNFFGALRVCRAVLPAMRSQQRGYIINIGSIGGILALPYQSMYSASKFALEGMSEALRMEIRSFGIRVVLIEPGYISPGMKPAGQVRGDDAYRPLWDEWAGTDLKVTGPSGRPGPELVAAAIRSAIEDPATPFRVPVGDDAVMVLGARSQMDDATFEAAMRSTLGLTW